MDVAQAAPYIQTMTYEAGMMEYDDFPRVETPVCILGTTYSALHELEDISEDMRSRLWFTYRWGFAPIGGEGPTSDQGWGCMLRCGQMMLGQALINLHLGRAWRWSEGKNDPKYYKILQMFQDKRDFTSCYSIHQIANMGASEGKAIGEWFGPNTVAQVLKKLAVYEDWSKLKVHVALDNTVIIEDIRTICKCSCDSCKDSIPAMDQPEGASTLRSNNPTDSRTQSLSESASPFKPKPNSKSGNHSTINSTNLQSNNYEHSDTRSRSSQSSHNMSLLDQVKASNVRAAVEINADSPSVLSSTPLCQQCLYANLPDCSCQSNGVKHWNPLLLVIPLRLGLTDINPVYIDDLKKCFHFKESVGIIGGKPNQAHWFIGTVGEELIFLDPHTCQPVEDSSPPGGSDDSYHCPYKCRMPVSELDPSIALGFFCATEQEFDEMCRKFHKLIISGTRTPLFEVHEKRPKHWPPFEPYAPEQCSSTEFEEVASVYDSDEEFVML